MRLIPRDEQFYTLFTELATRLSISSKLLSQLFADPAQIDQFVAQIKQVEHEADDITREVIARLDRSFVTPFDREDIHALASQLDNVIDLLDGTARRAAMFHITECREPARQLCDVLIRAASAIEAGVKGMKDPKIVIARGQEIKRLEEEGDAIYHEAVGALFLGSPDPLEVIKWKELFDKLEDALDECEDVANALESIVLKNG